MPTEISALTVAEDPPLEESSPLMVADDAPLSASAEQPAPVARAAGIDASGIRSTLPAYYWENGLMMRLVQAYANEFARVEAYAERVRDGAVPTLESGDEAVLDVWESTLQLPVRAAGVDAAERRRRVGATIASTGASSSAEVLEVLSRAAGAPVTVRRNEPQMLTDVLVTPFDPASFRARMILALAEDMWPAHRHVVLVPMGGFKLDASRLDVDPL